jgi:hypothetical protein
MSNTLKGFPPLCWNCGRELAAVNLQHGERGAGIITHIAEYVLQICSVWEIACLKDGWADQPMESEAGRCG